MSGQDPEFRDNAYSSQRNGKADALLSLVAELLPKGRGALLCGGRLLSELLGALACRPGLSAGLAFGDLCLPELVAERLDALGEIVRARRRLVRLIGGRSSFAGCRFPAAYRFLELPLGFEVGMRDLVWFCLVLVRTGTILLTTDRRRKSGEQISGRVGRLTAGSETSVRGGLGQPTALDQVRDGGVAERGLERLADFLDGAFRRRMACGAGQVGRLPGQGVHCRSARSRELAKLVSSRPLLSVLQGSAEIEKLGDLRRVGPRQKVHHPRGPSGTPELVDLLGHDPVAGFACFRHPFSPTFDEFLGRAAVELVGDLLEIHR